MFTAGSQQDRQSGQSLGNFLIGQMETIPAASENAANEAPEPEMTPEEAEEQLFWEQFAGREVQVICLFHAE